MSDTSTRISEWILRTDNRSAIRGLKEVADQGNTTSRSLKASSDEDAASLARVREESGALRDSMVGLAGMVGLGGVAFGLKDLKDSAVALQSDQAQLQQALRDTGQTAGDTYNKLAKGAEDLSTKGGFGTTENLQALTQFVGETKNASEAQRLLGLSTDIARRKGEDLSQTEGIVAKAYTGQAKGLQTLLGPMAQSTAASVGLSVAHEKEIAAIQDKAAFMGKLGGAYLRQAEINDHITAQQQELATLDNKRATAQQVLAAATQYFAGSTAKFNSETAGKASNLSNEFHNLTESLGTALLPAMNKLLSIGAEVGSWMAKNKTLVLDLVLGLAGLGVAFGVVKAATAAWNATLAIQRGVLAASGAVMDVYDVALANYILEAGEASAVTKAWIAVQSVFDAAMDANPIGLVTIAIVGLVGVTIELVSHWHHVEQVASSVWHSITGAVSTAWHDIEHAVSSGANWVWSKIKWLGDEAKKLWSDSPLGGLVGFGSNLLGGHVGRAFGDLAQGATLGAYQANTGTIGMPGRNVWQNQAGQVDVHIQPQTTQVNLDGREVARAVTRAVLQKAARGPSNGVGGSLVTNAPGLPVGG